MFTKQAMVKTVPHLVTQEIAAGCSDKFPSFFLKSAECFEVDTVITEVHSRAPTLFSILRSALRTKTSRRNEGMIIVVIAGIIFKHRRSCCSLVQQMVSLVLYAGHASKQVSIGNQS